VDKQLKKHILVVDDEQSIRELVRDILEEEGFQVTAVANGVEALETIGTHETIDLIISDIRMPVMGGVQLLEKVRENNPFPPPMIFITGYADITPELAAEKGVVAYLKKPMSINELLVTIQNALNSPPPIDRQHPRVNTHLRIDFHLKQSAEIISGLVYNMGRGGVFIETDKLGIIGEMIEFEILFGEMDKRSISGIAEILWQRKERIGRHPVGMGVRFIEISIEDEEYIAQHVEKLRKLLTIAS